MQLETSQFLASERQVLAIWSRSKDLEEWYSAFPLSCSESASVVTMHCQLDAIAFSSSTLTVRVLHWGATPLGKLKEIIAIPLLAILIHDWLEAIIGYDQPYMVHSDKLTLPQMGGSQVYNIESHDELNFVNAFKPCPGDTQDTLVLEKSREREVIPKPGSGTAGTQSWNQVDREKWTVRIFLLLKCAQQNSCWSTNDFQLYITQSFL